MSAVFALVLMAALTVPAFAAGSSTITIKDNGNVKVANHTFSAYRIFAGTLSDDKKTLSDIVWAEGVDGPGLLTALKADAAIGSKFADADTADKVAKQLEGATADEMVAFSRVVAEHLGKSAKDVTGGNITGLEDGYYFVEDTTKNIGEGDALSAFIVQLIGAVEINIKTDAPKIEKKLKNHDELLAAYRDANNVGIGDTIDYQIKSTVPDMSNYKKYYFIVHDSLSKGLKFNKDIAIKVGDTQLAADAYELTVTGDETAANGTALEIVFKNFKQYEKEKGAAIEITYTAELTKDAEIGLNGNPNEVYLEYSNNPNKEGDGENKPGPDDKDVTGVTPKDTVITYSTNLKIRKLGEGATSEEPLAGVKFTISGYAENDKITYKEEFVEDSAGEYYQLATNPATYTTIEPNALTEGKYASTTKKYKLVVTKGDAAQTVTYAPVQGTTDADGILDIGALIADGSLPSGTYVIHEDSTISGYNILDHDIIVTVTNVINSAKDIDFENPEKTTTITWKTQGEGAVVDQNGLITITVENKKGAELPSTGGMGTTIFYVIGSLLVVGAGVILVSRKRMNIQ